MLPLSQMLPLSNIKKKKLAQLTNIYKNSWDKFLSLINKKKKLLLINIKKIHNKYWIKYVYNPYKLPNFIFGLNRKSGIFCPYKIIMSMVLVPTIKPMHIFEWLIRRHI
jgi:hypothetical protein